MKKIISKQKADYWIKHLRLKPHPEGGYYQETYRSPEIIARTDLPKRYKGSRSFTTAIYFLLRGNQFSAFHRLKSDEIWHFYEGSPLLIRLTTKNKRISTVKLGLNADNGEQPQIVIKSGTWFAAELGEANSYTLIGCTVAPGFDFADFEMGARKTLCRKFPRHLAMITRLTKPVHD